MTIKRNYIIKLGGSVLTGKSDFPSFDQTNSGRITRELSPYYSQCIFVHGTGSYGKPPAIKYGYYKSGIIKKKDRLIAVKIKHSLRKLNQHVVETFLSAGIPAVGFEIDPVFDPQSRMINENKLRTFLYEFSNHEILPIFYGDLVPLENGDYKVLSSDEIVFSLTKTIRPDSVLFLSDVNGVFFRNSGSEDGQHMYMTTELTPKNVQNLYRDTKDSKDVSGGMNRKAILSLEISKYCRSCLIGNGYTPGLLGDFLKGKKVYGTYVLG